MRCYDILGDCGAVGSAYIKTEGLYFRINCKCKMEKQDIYRITVRSENGDVQLGICIPEGEWFVLNKRIPYKNLIDKNIEFYIESTTKKSEEHALTDVQNADIRISQLHKMRYRPTEGKTYIVVD